jgi:hypothetical protein
VDLPVVVSVLPESVPQEHELCMQVVLITYRSSPVHLCGRYSLLVGWWWWDPATSLGFLCVDLRYTLWSREPSVLL